MNETEPTMPGRRRIRRRRGPCDLPLTRSSEPVPGPDSDPAPDPDPERTPTVPPVPVRLKIAAYFAPQ